MARIQAEDTLLTRFNELQLKAVVAPEVKRQRIGPDDRVASVRRYGAVRCNYNSTPAFCQGQLPVPGLTYED